MPVVALGSAARSSSTLDGLRGHVREHAERCPGVYEFLDETGSVYYVGKAKNVRSRLLSYFTAPWPDAKSARLIRSAAAVRWRYLPSEFAALLEELRLIQRLRPFQNVHGNRTTRRTVFVKLTGGPAPKLRLTTRAADPDARYYGPFRGSGRAAAALRVLNDALGLRDCRQGLPMAFSDQADLFAAPLAPRCVRHELGTCLGPCAGRCATERYARAVGAGADFLAGRTAEPLAHVLERMADAADSDDFERAALWREKLEAVEWLFGAVARLATALESLSFVYLVRDATGGRQDRVYLIRRGLIVAEAALPSTPIERLAFAAEVELRTGTPGGTSLAARSAAEMDQILLVTSWFRTHPEAFEATTPYDRWLQRH